MDLVKNEVIITGINGFVAEHLARHLKNKGYFVTGIGRDPEPNPSVAAYVDSYIICDLLDADSVNTIPLADAKAIVHLAGFASVSDSFNKPDLYREGNATITDNLLSAATTQGFDGRTILVSTGAVYESPQDMPLRETSPIGSSAPYPYGKIRAEEVAREYIQKGLSIVIARPFNHIGPGQAEGFLLSDLYAQLMHAQESDQKIISVGNLKTRRDYSDVRDIVAAYELLIAAPEPIYDTYNVCSGNSYSGEDILDEIKKAVSAHDIEAIIDPDRVRPTDAMEIVGDSTRLREEFNWQPTIPLSQTVQDFVTWKQSI